MIIERKYVPFGTLKETDKEAFEIYEKAFNESYSEFDEETRKRQYEELLWLCLNQREMGWCFRKICDVIDGFERLDKERPYDNGFDYEAVNKVYVVSKDTNRITLHLVNKFYEAETLVKVVEIVDEK